VAKNTYTMTVLGSSFTLRSDDDIQHLRSVADYFAGRVQEIQSALPTASPLRVAVLSALNIVDELLRERRSRQGGPLQPDRDSREIQEITERIIANIDDSLRESPDGS
jgi:cell division protein ZapA (FtsZ GTPase activity inhibitor)